MRPALGPNTLRKYEAELRTLDGLGLQDIEMDSLLTLVLTHVEAVARAQAGMRKVQQDSGVSDHDWWAVVGPALDRYVDAAAFPLADRVGSASSEAYAGVYDPTHALQFGLTRIFDSIDLLITPRKPRTPRKRVA